MRRRALVGSLAVHGAVVVALVVFVERGEPSPPDAPRLELVELVDREPSPAATGPGGGSPGLVAHAATSRPRSRRAVERRTDATAESTLAQLATRSDELGDAGGGGEGGGLGGGRGTGIGLGAGDGAALREVPQPPPPPAVKVAPPSRARPARLIYPTRERDASDAQLFVARVIVDRDGYVVGARLVRGFGGPRDTEAADLIWRFRYAPALDDAGRAIRSTFDQRFLVNR
jgi:hypothetical protein